MKKVKALRVGSIVLLSLYLILAGCSTASTDPNREKPASDQQTVANETITLSLADYQSPQHFQSVNGTQKWMKRVEELTNGKVKFNYYPSEQLAKGSDLLDLVRTGGADLANICHCYVAGKMPYLNVTNLPGMVQSSDEGTRASMELIRQDPILSTDFLANGIRPIYSYMSSVYEIYTTSKPVRTLDDLKGLKIRNAGGFSGRTLELLGAVPVSISAPEQYEALARNTIDGTLFTINSFPTYKLDEVIRYGTKGVDGPPTMFAISINEQVWQKLPEDVKEAMLQAGQEINQSLGRANDESSDQILKQLQEEGKIEILEVDREAFRQAISGIEQEWVEEMEANGYSEAAKVLEMYKEAIRKVRSN